MKKVAIIFLGLVALSYTVAAQEKDRSVGESVKEAGKTVAHETAEKASKAKSRIVDKVYEDKVGPRGETIYINEHSKYYWINEKGQKISISEARLKDNPDKD